MKQNPIDLFILAVIMLTSALSITFMRAPTLQNGVPLGLYARRHLISSTMGFGGLIALGLALFHTFVSE